MRILLDECVTRYLKRDLVGHQVTTVQEAGLGGLKNGALLRAAAGRYDVFVTVDQNLSYQQNLGAFDIAVLILVAKNNTYAALKPLAPKVLQLLQTIESGTAVRVS
jgi:hypothetical protein